MSCRDCYKDRTVCEICGLCYDCHEHTIVLPVGERWESNEELKS